MRDKLINRIKRHINRMSKDYQNDIQFSEELANNRMLGEVFEILHWNTLSISRWNKVHSFILSYLTQNVETSIKKYKNTNESSVSTKYEHNAPIWVCWWQGEEAAPLLVRKCISTVREHSGDHPVNLISMETVSNYIDIPARILEMSDRDKIKLANLADYIRCSLISKWGGIWIDATVFVTDDIPNEYFEKVFYTVNGKKEMGRYVAGGRWATYVIGGWKDSKLFCFLKDAFEEYFNKNDFLVDYFLIDYLIECAYQNFPDVQEVIDAVPLNNPHRFALRDAMLNEATDEEAKRCIKKDTVFYKLSYKSLYGTRTKDGRETFYSTLVEQ